MTIIIFSTMIIVSSVCEEFKERHNFNLESKIRKMQDNCKYFK